MIKKAILWVGKPGFGFYENSNNPFDAGVQLGKANSAARKVLSLQADGHSTTEEMETVESRAKANELYIRDLALFSVTPKKELERYHTHVVLGSLAILLAITLLMITVVCVFWPEKLNVFTFSQYIPALGYGSLLSAAGLASVLILSGLKNWYFAKMISLKQRFTFYQYIYSGSILPTEREVIR